MGCAPERGGGDAQAPERAGGQLDTVPASTRLGNTDPCEVARPIAQRRGFKSLSALRFLVPYPPRMRYEYILATTGKQTEEAGL